MARPALSVRDLTVGAPGFLRVPILDLPPGSWTVLRGPSGGGKSTLLDILAGLRRRQPASSEGLAWSGTVWAGDVELSAATIGRYRRSVAWLPQRPELETGVVRESFTSLAGYRDSGFTSPAAAVAAAEPLLERLDLPRAILDQPAETLSGGETTRVALTRLIILKRPVVLLDEPGAALDEPRSQAAAALVRHALRESAVLVVAHDAVWEIPESRRATIHNGVLTVSSGNPTEAPT